MRVYSAYNAIFPRILRQTLVFVLLKLRTDLTQEAVSWAGSPHPAGYQEADLACRVACFLRHIYDLETAVSDACILGIHLVFLPFHRRIELGFHVNNTGFE